MKSDNSRADGAAPDALELLHRDHEEVSSLFETALSDDAPAAQKRSAIKQILDALTVHTKMEESIFYPALRQAGKTQEKDSVLEAAEEHAAVKDLIKKIGKSEGRDETLKAKLTVLKEMVEHHVHEEESTMFDEARKVLGKRLGELGDRMQAFKDRANGTGGGRKRSGAKKSTAKKAASRKSTSGRKAAARSAE